MDICLVALVFVLHDNVAEGKRLGDSLRQKLLSNEVVERVVPNDWKIFRLLDFFGVSVRIEDKTLLVGAQNNWIYTGKALAVCFVLWLFSLLLW